MKHRSPLSAANLLSRYGDGERTFSDYVLDEQDLSNTNMEGITFQRCFLTATLRGANLTDAKFEECNVKSADFGDAILRRVSFATSGVCGIMLDGAGIEDATFEGADYYGYEMQAGDIPPV